ncbi:uncharacterized protein DNG_04348 [Cephalotrichum gorgonifer]|uniref:endo-1,4-beta-xylanase n=1 Tax=Cephalotrichum gorgonifer TaxID=2041049 RepID=A0AAE8MYM0_9PEZI|nr:uncharacterized protein DNG_04348 [Cephalotrichum gorgonifer]
MKDHITEVVSHYKGQSVYNNGTYRSSVFYDTIGPAYIPIAFSAAAEADPDAKLYYSDFAIELPGPKARAAVEIVKLIQAYEVKIDGVGIQGHFDHSVMPPQAHYELDSMATYDEQVAVMEQNISLGVEVAITEMDASVLTPITPANETIYDTQPEVYYNATAACLTFKECVGITIWDWTDRYTWVPTVFPDMGDALPWDKDLVKKPAYDGIMRAFTSFEPSAGTGGRRAVVGKT